MFFYCLQTSGFDWIVYFFHFEGFSYCLRFMICCCFLFLFNSLFFLGDILGFTFLYHVCLYWQLSSHASLSLFHFGSCRLLLFIFRNFGVLPIFSDSTCTVTYCRRLMLLRLGTSSVITSQTAWFACLIDSSTFLFTDILGRRGLSSIMIFSHSVFAFLISLIRSSISDGLHDGSTSSSYVAS